jgi:hypothetical protein
MAVYSAPMDTCFEDFASAAKAAGFDEVLQRDWASDAVIDTHTHPFAVRAVVTAGEMWLSDASGTRHLRPGDRFELERDVPHAERYGPQGASYWVARRNAA